MRVLLQHPTIDFSLNNEAQVRTPISTTSDSCCTRRAYLQACTTCKSIEKHPNACLYRWLRKDRQSYRYICSVADGHASFCCRVHVTRRKLPNTCLYRWLSGQAATTICRDYNSNNSKRTRYISKVVYMIVSVRPVSIFVGRHFR